MTQNYTVQVEREMGKRAEPLVERLDPAIGEATSVMGTVLTELLRRSLRGGVMKIGEELHAFAAERVAEALAEKTPALELRVNEVAEHTARSAATEVAVEEVKQLEQRTSKSDAELAAQIEAKAHEAQVSAAEAARQLAGRIEEAEKQTKDIILDTARGLADQIADAEKRVAETAHSELNQQIDHLLQRSKKGVAVVEARIKTVEETAADLARKLHEEHDGRRAEGAALRTELVRSMEDGQARLREEIAVLLRTNRALEARVAELEKPRGLRALWAWLRGKGKRKGPAEPSGNGAAEEAREGSAGSPTPRP